MVMPTCATDFFLFGIFTRMNSETSNLKVIESTIPNGKLEGYSENPRKYRARK